MSIIYSKSLKQVPLWHQNVDTQGYSLLLKILFCLSATNSGAWLQTAPMALDILILFICLSVLYINSIFWCISQLFKRSRVKILKCWASATHVEINTPPAFSLFYVYKALLLRDFILFQCAFSSHQIQSGLPLISSFLRYWQSFWVWTTLSEK